MDRSKLKIAFFGATVISLAVSVVLLILGFALELGAVPKIVLIAAAIVGLVLTGLLGYFAYLLMDTKINYFLYSSNAKRNISVDKLTFQTINARLNRFLSGYAASEGKLWNDRVLDNPYLEMDESFKPLVAYKMLFSLAEKDMQAGWLCLENASDDTVAFICRAIESNNDSGFSSAFASLMNSKPRNMEVIRDYLVKNKRYIQTKITKYVIEHISEFNE